MSVTLTASTIALGGIYLQRASSRLVITAIRIGLTWMVANWALDALMFIWGPMRMGFAEYINIGVAYFIIPVITTGLGVSVNAAIGRTISAQIRS